MPLNARQKAFLAAYSRVGWVARAAECAGIHRTTHYLWLDTEPDYAAAFITAERDLNDNLVGAAIEKSLVGVPEPVIHQGALCFAPARDKESGEILRNPETGEPLIGDEPLVIYKKSERLHETLLKAKLPSQFRDNVHVEHAGEIAILTERLAAGRARLKSAA